jgi:hypothetical protein
VIQRIQTSLSRRWALLTVALLVVVSYRVVLRMVGGALVSQQEADRCRYVVALGGDGRFDVAAGLIGDGAAEKVVVVKTPSGPLVELGILPPGHEVAIRELTGRGVAPRQILLVEVTERNGIWSTSAALGEWLRDRDENAVVLSGELGTRRLRFVFDRTLDDGVAKRLLIRPLPHREFNRRNWWRSRLGVKSVLDSSIYMLHAVLMPRPTAEDRVPD